MMRNIVLSTTIHACALEELTTQEQALIQEAIRATERSYAPYSNFHVGAAVRLANGTVVTGCNQENAAFPITICAERNALFAAANQHPAAPVSMLAIAARNENGLLTHPISPCGSCRQAMIETEHRYGQTIRILLYGTSVVYVIDGAKALLPLSFEDLE